MGQTWQRGEAGREVWGCREGICLWTHGEGILCESPGMRRFEVLPSGALASCGGLRLPKALRDPAGRWWEAVRQTRRLELLWTAPFHVAGFGGCVLGEASLLQMPSVSARRLLWLNTHKAPSSRGRLYELASSLASSLRAASTDPVVAAGDCGWAATSFSGPVGTEGSPSMSASFLVWSSLSPTGSSAAAAGTYLPKSGTILDPRRLVFLAICACGQGLTGSKRQGARVHRGC